MASKFRTRDYRPYDVIHVSARGYGRRRIFFAEQERVELLDHLRSLLNVIPASARPVLLAYALIDNHIHLLFHLGSDALAVRQIVGTLKQQFARRHNERHGRTGPVWESPYRGRVVRGGEDLVNVVAYIHLNPDSSLRDQNSSHAIYTGQKASGIVDTRLVLKTFGGREQYIEFFSDTARLRGARTAARARIHQ